MSKRIWVLPVLVAMVLALGSGVGLAMPSYGGPTGIVSVPNALVAAPGDLQVAATYQKVTLANLEGYTEDDNVWGLQALGAVADGAELWAAYQHVSSDFSENVWGIGGKVQFLREPKDQAYLALFASYQHGAAGANVVADIGLYEPSEVSVDVTAKVTTLGIAATKDFTPAGIQGSQWASGAKLFGTVGLMYKKADEDIDVTVPGAVISGSESDSLTRPFLGAEFVTSEGTTLGLEYRWKDSNMDSKAVFSAVLRHAFAQGFTGEIGTTNANLGGFGTDDQNWFVRLGYSFALGAKQ